MRREVLNELKSFYERERKILAQAEREGDRDLKAHRAEVEAIRVTVGLLEEAVERNEAVAELRGYNRA